MADGEQALNLPEELSGNEALKPFIGKDPVELAKSYVEVHKKANTPVTFEELARPGLEGYDEDKRNAFLKKTKDVGSLAKNYLELEKRLGTSIQIPGKDAKPEEIKAFRAKLGVPDSLEGYEIKLPDGTKVDEKAIQGFKELALAVGMTPEMVQKAVEFDVKRMTDFIATQEAATKQAQEKLDGELRKEWGSNYDANLEVSRRAAKQFASADDLEALEKIIGTPALVKVFHKIGKQMSEGRRVEGDAEKEQSKKDAQKRISEIEAKFDYKENKALMAERSELYKVLYPEEEEA